MNRDQFSYQNHNQPKEVKKSMSLTKVITKSEWAHPNTYRSLNISRTSLEVVELDKMNQIRLNQFNHINIRLQNSGVYVHGHHAPTSKELSTIVFLHVARVEILIMDLVSMSLVAIKDKFFKSNNEDKFKLRMLLFSNDDECGNFLEELMRSLWSQ